MQINALQIRNGMVLDMEGELYKVTWTMHRTPGKGNACMQTKMKHVQSGKNLEKRFLSNENVEKAELESKSMQYLYQDDGYIFMDNESYEQLTMPEGVIEGQEAYIKEGDSYDVLCYDGAPIGLALPKTMDFEVTSAPPEIKKATASSSLRPIEIENGMTVQAPTFIKTGDRIRINTDNGEYIERV